MPHDAHPAPLNLADIEATRALIAPHVLTTPTHAWRGVEVDALGGGAEIMLKLELFQHTGTFKARGALSVMLRMDQGAIDRGVTAVSAGNHAIAVAFAARKLGASAKVVMLASANLARIARCRAYGRRTTDHLRRQRRRLRPGGTEIEKEEGRTFVHPFDGPPDGARNRDPRSRMAGTGR